MNLPNQLSSPLSGFLNELESKDRSKFTITAYKKDLEQLINYLKEKGIKTWNQATTEVLDKYVNFLKQEKDYTLKTISRKINSMKTFYRFLISRKFIDQNYANHVRHPKIDKQIPRILSPLEYKALRDTARENLRLYTIIELLLQTGMRIGELSRLKLEDIDLEKKNIVVQAFSSYPKRNFEINPVLEEALRNYLRKISSSRNSRYFFFAKSGNNLLIRNIRSSVDKAFKKTGIRDVKVNDLRNTFIIYQLEHGMELETLAKIVGHKKVTTTENYLEYIESRPRKTTKRITPL